MRIEFPTRCYGGLFPANSVRPCCYSLPASRPAAPGPQAEEAAAEAEALRAAARSTTVEVHMVNEEAGSQVRRRLR